ncbi:MAG: hypothetical protein IJT38_02315 [Clostridia bacterium]|nr:hypothetical protein [Clostridia bacterium]
MNVNTDILKKHFGDFVIFYNIYAYPDAETSLKNALHEIHTTIPFENRTDSEIIDEIVIIFTKHNLIIGTKNSF